MAKRIKGITIELDGETKGLDKALADVNKRSRDLQSELRDVDRLLKFDPGNTEALAQKQKLLTEQVENTESKLKQLKQAEQQVQQQFAKGDIKEEQYRSFKREVQFTEAELKKFKKRLDSVDDGKSLDKVEKDVKDVKKETDKAEKSARNLGEGFKKAAKGAAALGAAGAAAIGGLVAGMEDTNRVMARLNANAASAGFDPKFIEEQTRGVAALTGELDSAVETVSNLMATDMDQNELAKTLEYINGAAIKFSDTLKTEGIADGLQETLATGAAVGPFAELLERSGVNLEVFNEGLETAQKEGKATNFVLQELSKLGLESALEEYKQLNPELYAHQEAQQAMNAALAELSVTLMPLVTMVTKFLTKILDWINDNVELVKSFDSISEGLAALFPKLLEDGQKIIGNFISGIVDKLPEITATGVQIIQKLLTGLVSAIPQLLTTWQEIMRIQMENLQTYLPQIIVMGINFLKSLLQGMLSATPFLVETLAQIITTFVNVIVENLPLIIESGIQMLQAVIQGIIDTLPSLIDTAITLVDQISTTIIENLPLIIEAGIKLLVSLIEGIVEALPQLVQQAIKLVIEVAGQILKNLPLIIAAGIDLIFALIEGLIGAIPDLIAAIPQVIKAIFDAFGEADWSEIGKNIIRGLISGIKNMFSSLVDSIGGVIGGAIDWAKKKLDINSPSGVFEQIGEFTGEGFVKGIHAMMNDVKRASEEMAQASIPDVPTGTASTSNTFNFQGMMQGATFVVREEADIHKIARELYNLTKSSARSKGVIMA